ncbi:MAG: 16S rRNA (guanine(966)-N(2))-methyltransferase RsmD [Bacilli bacterium]
MRIIGGKFRSRKLNTLSGMATRPTLDGTKEAIFNSLGNYLPNFVVLDVFGGSGALGLESISRGASLAYIVDNSIDAINVIKSNVSALKVEKEAIILHCSYDAALKRLSNQKFDLVFIDPPFRMKVIEEIINFLIEHNMINDGGFIMAEYPKEDIVQRNYEGFRIKLCRTYSSSEILILEKE